MRGAPEQATVLDTSVLSNFAHVDRVELLLELPRCVTVESVRTELEAGSDTHPYLTRAVAFLDEDIPVLLPTPPAEQLEEELLETLDPGEAQALAVTAETDGVLVTDDGDARAEAKQRDVTVTGSIGLLVRFIDMDAITIETADRYLKYWIDEAGFRAPARNIETFLAE